MMARKLILDVDTGTDDAVAIMMAAQSADFELLGCTAVWGNLDIEHTTDNTLRVLDHIGRSDVPVFRGLDRPFAPKAIPELPGTNKSKGKIHTPELPIPAPHSREQSTSAVEWLVETLRTTTQQITLVPVGPLTNIAVAISLDPSIVEAVEEVVIMGGGHAIGNVTPSAEANIWRDPVAAEVVFRADFSRVVVMPLDATHQAYVSRVESQELRATGTAAAVAASDFIDQSINGYASSQSMDNIDTAPIHDALCIAYLLDPKTVKLTACHITVDTTSILTFGRTIFDIHGRGSGEKNGFVALHADRKRFVQLVRGALAPVSLLAGPTTAPVGPPPINARNEP